MNWNLGRVGEIDLTVSLTWGDIALGRSLFRREESFSNFLGFLMNYFIYKAFWVVTNLKGISDYSVYVFLSSKNEKYPLSYECSLYNFLFWVVLRATNTP